MRFLLKATLLLVPLLLGLSLVVRLVLARPDAAPLAPEWTGETYMLAIGACVPWASLSEEVCANNVALVEAALTDRMGLESRHIHSLLGPAATYQGVLDGFAWLRERVKSGDRVILYYSGHGVLSEDTSGDEASGQDEILCLWSEHKPFSRKVALVQRIWMSDDLLGRLLRELPTSHQILIMETCHGAAVEHGLASVVPDYDHQDAALLAAARPEQLAMTDDSGRQGLFTTTLTAALHDGAPTLGVAFERARAATESASRRLCQATTKCVQQTPVLNDPLGLTDLPLSARGAAIPPPSR